MSIFVLTSLIIISIIIIIRKAEYNWRVRGKKKVSEHFVNQEN